MSRPDYPQHWHTLALAYLDSQLDAAQQLALAELAGDAQFHRCLADHALDAAMLHRLARQGALPAGDAADSSTTQPDEGVAESTVSAPLAESRATAEPVAIVSRTRPRTRSHLGILAVVGTMLVAASIGLWLSAGQRSGELPAPPLGTITHTSGTVTIRDAEGERTAATTLLPGETLSTGDVASSAVLRLPDGTRITLAGNSSLRLRPGPGGQQVVVDSGQITARVLPQPAAAPLLVNTQNAEVQVLGTEFQLSAADGLTRLDVTSGKVLLTRLRDRQSLEVTSGQFAVARDNSAKLTARSIPTLPDKFAVDFEQGLPPGWRSGEWVQDGLPGSSQGGVLAAWPRIARYGNDDHYEILSTNAWAEGQFGLFSIHEDSHLNFTYKLGQPEWFHILIGTRGEGLPSQNFESRKRKEWWSIAPDQWHTLSVPLRNFGRNVKRVGAIDFSVNPAGRVAYFVLISSQEYDRQMVIDRLWVSRGLPAESSGPNSQTLPDGSVLTPLAVE
jgi:ferric-dicitrate binding protein FerR (iron transport regulator)